MTSSLVEQLWGPAMAAGRLRVQEGRRQRAASTSDEGWLEVERYYVVPSAERPTMLLPTDPAPALLAALTNYRGLRTARRQAQRLVLGAAARIAPLPFPQLSLSVPADIGTASPPNPLGELAGALGRTDLRAAIGVRTGANRKATLQLVDLEGAPAGFAKFAWSEQTALAVRREILALSADESLGSCRRPPLLTSGTYAGWPYLVSGPLPLSSRGVRGRTADPTVQEFHDLAPVTGRRPLTESRQLHALRARLVSLTGSDPAGGLVERTLELLDSACRDGREVVISARWHGDLTPWNSARDSDGRLWCWDWESTERDAVAGMDAVHWHLSLVQEAGGALDGKALSAALEAAAPVLIGLGHSRQEAAVVAAVYVASMVERAVALSVAQGGWEAGWLTVDNLADLVACASQGLLARV